MYTQNPCTTKNLKPATATVNKHNNLSFGNISCSYENIMLSFLLLHNHFLLVASLTYFSFHLN